MANYLVSGRQQGKTSKAIEWLKDGERTDTYPGWTRVLLVQNMNEYERLKHLLFETLEDFDHRVYTVEEWARALRVDSKTEVVIDNADWLFQRYLSGAKLEGATMSGNNWNEFYG